ncbi:polycomb protein Scm-like isoform X2 [Rhopilema esculentum]|uniref:polycomb protein Scm-like isoform X2 n=1 Tax=Rhopilema esculentum TaxID=499914 RepID=UPI0031CEF241
MSKICFSQVLSSIRVEFPDASEDGAYHIAARRWNMLSDEQRKTFGYEENASHMPQKLRGVHYEVSDEIDERESPSSDSRGETAKFGRCTWCKNYGNLNDYSTNLQGREIYCTGLCSKKCFEQAALKIINVETGYGLESSVYSESTPIRTSINLSSLNNEPVISRGEHLGNFARTHNDGSRSGVEAARPSTEVIRDKTVQRPQPKMDRPSSSLQIKRTDTPYRIAENAFDWTSYLKQTGSIAAPLLCFRMQRTSSTNTFQVGMKLEVKDPRQDSVVCIATVVTIWGPRLRLHLDGCPKSEDIWVLCDSGEIHPVGWCEGNRGVLQKPKGFSVEVASYTEYIKKALNSAELAPMSAFKSEPSPPKENKFATGMKLEAVDKKNPALVGVASVAEVDGDRVRIEFDGYKGSGYWTHFTDRDLFQAGWCFSNGYPLQPPGVQVVRPQPVIPYNNVSRNSCSPNLREKKSHQIATGHGEVDVTVNSGCNPGPYMDTKKVSSIPTAYKGDIGVVLKAILEDLIRCAYDPKTVLGFLKPGRGNIVVNAIADGVVYNCYLSTVDRVSTFWKVMEQFCDNLRCCTNLISGFELQTACPQCGRTGYARKGQSVSVKRTHDISDKPMDNNLSVCISSTPDSTAVGALDASEARVETRETAKRKRRNSILSHITTSPRSWSVENVAEFLEKTDLKDYANIFRDNDIDGKAMLLLKRDIVINYMGLKIGPAVKLLDLIDELNEADTHFG